MWLLNLVFLSTPNTSDQTLHTFNTPATNGWQNWQTVEADVNQTRRVYPDNECSGGGI